MRKVCFVLVLLVFATVSVSVLFAQDTNTVVVPEPPTGASELPDYAVDSVVWMPVPPGCFETNTPDTRFPCSTNEGQPAAGPVALANNSGIITTGDAPYLLRNASEGEKASYASLYGIVELEADKYPYSILPELYPSLMKLLGPGNWLPVGVRAVGLTGSETDISSYVNLSGAPIAPGNLGYAESYGGYWGYYGSNDADGLTGEEIGSVIAAQIKMMVYESKPAIKAWSMTPEGELPYATLNPKNCATIEGTVQGEITYCDVVNIHVFVTYDGTTWEPALFGAYNRNTGYEDLTKFLIPAPDLPEGVIPLGASSP